MNKRIILLLIVLILTIENVSALQQTVGELKANITIGDIKLLQYKVYNEDNVSVNVLFNIEGDVSNYTSFTESIILEPNEYRTINLTVKIPQEYNGNSFINGTIYALKEGSSDGQVQLNVRLGKRIKVYVEDNVKDSFDELIKDEPSNNVLSIQYIVLWITVIGVLLIIVYVVIKYRNRKKNQN